jgi:hypothetical protein
MELKYKVSELIEMYVNGIECIDDDIVVWSAKNLLHFLNTHNIGLHEVPSSFADSNQNSNYVTETSSLSFDFNNNRRYSLWRDLKGAIATHSLSQNNILFTTVSSYGKWGSHAKNATPM